MTTSRKPGRLKPVLAATAATAATAAVLTVGAGPAVAADAATGTEQTAKQAACLTTAQQRAKDLIAQRQATLSSLAREVDGSTWLTSADKAMVSTIIDSTRSGLTSLGATIAADPTCAQARTDAAKIFTDYRVYVIVAPQTHLLLAADHGQAALTHLQTAAGEIQTAITAAAAHGRDTVAAQAALEDLRARIADATTQFASAHSDAAALTPASWNADHDVTATARAFDRAGHQDVLAGISDVRAAVADLKK